MPGAAPQRTASLPQSRGQTPAASVEPVTPGEPPAHAEGCHLPEKLTASMEFGHTPPIQPSSCASHCRSTPNGLPANAPAFREQSHNLARVCAELPPYASMHRRHAQLAETPAACHVPSPLQNSQASHLAQSSPEPSGSVATRGSSSRSRMSSRCHAAACPSSQWLHRTVIAGCTDCAASVRSSVSDCRA